jgi:hypothetical protein
VTSKEVPVSNPIAQPTWISGQKNPPKWQISVDAHRGYRYHPALCASLNDCFPGALVNVVQIATSTFKLHPDSIQNHKKAL